MKKLSLLLLLLSAISIFAQSELVEIKQLSDEGKYNLALEKAGELLKHDSLNINLLYKTAELYELNRQYNKSAEYFEKVLHINNDIHKAYLALASVYTRSGRTAAALKTYKQLYNKDNKNIAVLSNLANIYFGKKPDTAYLYYEKLHLIDTLNTEYLFQMARCRLVSQETLKGFNLLKKAFAIDSTNINVAIYLNKLYSDATTGGSRMSSEYYDKMYDSAMLVINKVIEKYPKEGKLYFRRGSTQYTKNYHFRSVPDFRKAIELGFNSYKQTKRLGNSLFTIKKYKEAKEVYESTLTRDTADYQVCMYMGNIFNELDEADSALLFFNKAIELLTPAPMVMSSIYRGLAESYSIKKQYVKQIECIKKRTEYTNKLRYYSTYYLYEIAKIYDDKLNNKKAAIKYYTAFLDKSYNKIMKEQILSRINQLKEDLHFGG